MDGLGKTYHYWNTTEGTYGEGKTVDEAISNLAILNASKYKRANLR